MTERIGLLPTCVVDSVAPHVGASVVRVLRAAGYEVSVPKEATCCGQPAWNAGFAEEAATVARTTLAALEAEPAETICVPAGSCATMIRVFWPELFHVVGDEDARRRAERLGGRIMEFSEVCAARSDRLGGTFRGTVAYHHSCHMFRELRIAEEPESLLDNLDGCERRGWTSADRCCGFGGLFSVKQPEMSVAMADDKVDSLLASGADALVGCDQSCLMHLEGRLRRRDEDLPVRHLAEVLDEALRARERTPAPGTQDGESR